MLPILSQRENFILWCNLWSKSFSSATHAGKRARVQGWQIVTHRLYARDHSSGIFLRCAALLAARKQESCLFLLPWPESHNTIGYTDNGQ